MKIYGLYLFKLIVIFIVLDLSSGKTLISTNVRDNDASLNSDRYNGPIKNNDKSASYHSVSGTTGEADEEGDSQTAIVSAALKLPKINMQGTQCYDVASSKRSTEDDLMAPPHNSHVKYKKRRSPYGIVYNQGKPIGILEPISRIYEFQNVPEQSDSEFKMAVKRDLNSETAGVAPEEYINTPNNFKIDSNTNNKPLSDDASLTQNVERRREKTVNKRSPIESPEVTNSAKSKRDLSDKNLAQIEENLKQIMSDLGLIKTDSNISKRDLRKVTTDKRDAMEDEDLESGMNKIGITKELHSTDSRNKNNNMESTLLENSMLHGGSRKQLHTIPNEDVNIEGEPANKKAKKIKISDYRSEGEKFIRKKRQQSKANTENNDLMKGLETSGELTVSGNKSPLASSSTASLDSEGKQKMLKERNEKREKQAEDQEFEKRLQRNIQNKLTKIKEEVKREISTITDHTKKAAPQTIKREIKTITDHTKKATPQTLKREINTITDHIKKATPQTPTEKKRNADSDKKKNVAQKETKPREKRNLMDKETDQLNPGLDTDEPQKAHIRKRRDIISDADESNVEQQEADKENRINWHEISEEDKQIADLNKRESSELASKPHHDPRRYEFQYRTKRKEDFKVLNDPESKTNQENMKQFPIPDEVAVSNLDKRNFKESSPSDGKNQGEGSEAGFWDAQNQNVARVADNQATRVVVPRDSEVRNAPAALNCKSKNEDHSHLNNPIDAENLEKLVSESTSLSQSVKNERGADQISNIEIELHSGNNEKVAGQKATHTKREKQNKYSSDEDISKKKRESKHQLSQKSKKVTVDANRKIEKRAAQLSNTKTGISEPSENQNQKVPQENFKVFDGETSKLVPTIEGTLKDINIDGSLKSEGLAKDEVAKINEKSEVKRGNQAEDVSIKDNKIANKRSTNDGKDDENKEDKMRTENDSDDDNKIGIKRSANGEENDSKPDNDDKPIEEMRTESESEADKIGKKRSANGQENENKIENDAKPIEGSELAEDSKLVESNDSNGARLGRSSNNVLEEKQSKPDLTLEEMQRLDSENNSKRKRRYAQYNSVRENERPNNMQFRTYRGDEDEADDESDEFDDDNFDDRTANLIRKRDLAHRAKNDEFDEDYEPVGGSYENGHSGHVDKRNTYLHKYMANMNSDVYDNPNYLYDTDNVRKKRHVFTDLVGIHSGGPMLRHLAAARERSLQPLDKKFRMKRLEKGNQKKESKNQVMTGLSEADFGGLPQSYEGELSRFKRVKRDDTV